MQGEVERREAHAHLALKADVLPPLGAQGCAPGPAMQHSNGIGRDALRPRPVAGKSAARQLAGRALKFCPVTGA